MSELFRNGEGTRDASNSLLNNPVFSLPVSEFWVLAAF
jgi:hypothetical protein